MSRSSLISSCKKDLIDIYKHAIEAVKPDNLIKNAININGDKLSVKDSSNGCEIDLDLKRSGLHIIGGGKSVLSMACGLADLANQAGICPSFSCGHLSLPLGLENILSNDFAIQNQLNSIDVKCSFGSKDNLPDERSVQASKSIIDKVKIACDKDRENSRKPLFIVLISGGGSACLTSPRFIDLQKKLQLIKFLVQKGANIVELNKVRRYFSAIKGGELARHILRSHPESRVVTLILSDVIGDPVEYIASGPTFLSSDSLTSTHKQTMLNILEKYNYSRNLLEFLTYENPAIEVSDTYGKERVHNVVIGNNTIALDAAIRQAQLLDYHVELIGNKLEGFSDTVVERILASGKQASSKAKKGIVIGGGEATINKLDNETWGLGGRVQEMAIDYMVAKLLSKKTDDIREAVDVFLAGSTDGQDGPTDVAACMASLADIETYDHKPFNLEMLLEAKREHNSYNFWTKHKPDWLVKTGLTGTNVMDLYMYLSIAK